MSFVGALYVSRPACKYRALISFFCPGFQDRSPAPQETYATAPYAKARRVKRMVYCIFVLLILLFVQVYSEGEEFY